MRRVWMVAILALATAAAGQQPGVQTAKPSAEAASNAHPAGATNPTPPANIASAQLSGTVKVYEPHKPIVAPRLLAPAEDLDFPKHCTNVTTGESELSLLVDTSGRARNVMFQRPSGTMTDRFAIIIVNRDRFAPGTLNGKRVVVAETLDMTVEACIGLEKDETGKLESAWLLKSRPRQKLKKPKNPPQVAELAPLKAPQPESARKITRPDFFGNGETAPVLLYSEYANYTPSHPGTKGTCEVSLLVDAHGLPQDLHVLKKLDPGLDRSAVAAVENYRFFPAIKDNKQVPAAVVVSVDFTPPRN